ncbi:MAG: hypothetical protein WCS65_07790 [Verrucomicrobiae bacterium]
MRRILVAILCACALVHGQDVRRALPLDAGAGIDEQAKFLAGYPLPPTGALGKWQATPAGLAHAKAFESLWARYNENYFTPMRLWAAAEVSPRILPNAPVFYFFGGPDAVSALALYPAAEDYLLGGLEPVGSLPEPGSLPDDRLRAALDNLRTSTEAILSFGFFITKEMKSNLDATDFHGVLPVLLTFVAMTGGEVLDVCYFGIDQEGSAQDFGTAFHEAKGMLPGVRITFRKDAASPPQRIHYVQANVADDALKSRASVLKWAARFGKGNVYLKAASYLLHKPYFSSARNFLLGQAASVLQDDSGIPFSFFQNGEWRCWFFGTYTGTLDIFKKHYQPDLERAFRVSGTPLALGTGYKWRVGESNLLFAIRQTPPKAEPVSRE